METMEERELRTRLHVAAEAAPSGDPARAVQDARRALRMRRRKVAAVAVSGVAMVSVVGVVAATGLVTRLADGRAGDGPVVASTPTRTAGQHGRTSPPGELKDPLLRRLDRRLNGFEEYVETYRDACASSTVVVATRPGKQASDELRDTAKDVMRQESEAGRGPMVISFSNEPVYRGVDYAEGRTKYTMAELEQVATDLRDRAAWPAGLRGDLGPELRVVVVPGLGHVRLEVAHATTELRRHVSARHPGGVVWVRNQLFGDQRVVFPCGPR
jgi:hypothetical protein